MIKTSILVVEDDATARTLIRSALDPERVEMVEAADGREALEVLDEWRNGDSRQPWPALILLDLGLPGMGGLDVLKRVRGREDTRRIPVVIFSSHDEPIVIRTAYELGANGYVKKPTRAKQFLEAVAAITAFWLNRNRRMP